MRRGCHLDISAEPGRGQSGRMQTWSHSLHLSRSSGDTQGEGPQGEACLLRALQADPGQRLQDCPT